MGTQISKLDIVNRLRLHLFLIGSYRAMREHKAKYGNLLSFDLNEYSKELF